MQAFTAAPHHDVLVLLIQIALLLACARLLGEVAQRFGQPTVVGEILAGIVLGPSLLSGFFPAVGHWIVPQTPESGHLLEVVSLFGAMFLLLLTGLETDLRLIRRHSRTALAASAGGIVVPFATGFMLGQYLPGALLANNGERLVFALFLATAMSISAIPVIAKVLLDLNLMRRDIGQTIIAAGMADDAVGWMLLSVVVGLARSGELEAGAVAWSVGKVVLFMVVSFTAARWLVARTIAVVQDRMGSHFRMLSAVVVLTFAWGSVAQALGLEAMLGAFVMGILLGQLPRLPHRIPEHVEQMAIGIFAPIFFAVAGLKVNARSLLEPRLIMITLLVILVASFGKVVGGYFATRFFARCDHWTALSFGVGLNARGAMEIIIASIGLSLGILSQEMFSIIVVMAITTSVMAPPLLRWTLSHIRPGENEMRRLQREEAAETSLLGAVRRVLLPVRCVVNERRSIMTLEAQLVTQMHSHEPLALTLLTVPDGCTRDEAAAYLDRIAELFPGIETTRKIVEGRVGDVILDEAQKDYDLLLLGASHVDPSSRELFNPLVDYVMRVSPCPTLVVKGRLSDYHWPPRRVLIPTNGSVASRNAADVGFTLSDSSAEAVVLHVVREPEGSRAHNRETMLEVEMPAARAIVDELVKRGEVQEVRTTGEVLCSRESDQTILRYAEEEGVDLIVLGTDLRPGSDRLFLGPRVERILMNAHCPVAIVNAPQ
ncbi:MAG TPA: cation:proton antiporter [Longimicrobium sp.]|jgi:Kef-type K+ transport system membrane component KefB/nucleotide-binding universal stress UspA family protein|uniref:cation:proton antiporter domain-containing protein n=1 Tax=Longimicrobium sp. TaxID=2029185 RepID=UPI002ED8997B